MLKVTHKALAAMVALLVLGGCTDNGFLFRSFGSYGKSDSDAIYKIGEAYQIKDEWYTPKEDYSYNEKGVASWYQEEPGKLTANGEKYDEDLMTASHKTLPLPSIVRVTNLENGNVAIVRVNDRGPFVNNRLIDVSQKAAEQLEFNMVGTTMVQVEILPEESKRLKAEILKRNGGQMEEENVSGASVLSSDVQISELSDQPKVLYQPEENLEEVYSAKMTEDSTDNQVKIASITQPDEPISLIPSQNQAPASAVSASVATPASSSTAVIAAESTPQLIAPISGHYVQAGAFSSMENAKRLQSELEQFGPVQIYDTTTGNTTLHRVRMGPFETRESAQDLLDKLGAAGYGNSQIIFEP